MSARSLFVTGTDTGVGKTVVACTVLRQLAADGQRAVGFKPVASGCETTPHGLRNDDALALQAASGLSAAYEQINPDACAPPIAPQLAGAAGGQTGRIGGLDQADAALAAADLLTDSFEAEVAAIPSREACINASSARMGAPAACALHGLIDAMTDTYRAEVTSALNLRIPAAPPGDTHQLP